MAHLSSPWEPAGFVSWESCPKDLGSSPIGWSTSPEPKAGNTATMVAFRNARDTFRKSLSEKDMKRIMIPTGPEDVVNEIDKWLKRHLNSKVAASVRFGLGQLQRFNASIDMLAQGTPSPGCLLWGSIKFVLTIVQDAVQAYEQLCKALIRMIDCLPRIEIYAETFLESSLVVDCVNAFYISAIRFWAKACKFYRRRRLWKILHVIWNDFDAEFADLEADMIRNRDRVEGAALAEHIGDSRAAKVNQQFVNSELLDRQTSARRKEITAWLAPIAYDVEYFSNDLAGARALRHPKTCMWILQKTEVAQLLDSSCGLERSMLWIYANPGAGKTVLSSFLIDHLKSAQPDPVKGHVFYFFCKNTDVDKNTPTVVVRSLLYQLYNSVENQKAGQSLKHDIGVALDRSGQQKAVNFTVLWQLFSTHIINHTPATIIIDALDECQDPSQLTDGLKELSTLKFTKVIVTSRKESHLHNELNDVSSIEIAPEDVDADIAAFVEAKVEASSRLSHPLVRELVVTKLCNAHDGMFLWVYLVLKELKSCISMAQVQDALAKLPTGLDGIYKSILDRLQTTLSRSSFDLCSKVLTWVVSAVRPLGIYEIKHALTLHYEMNGDTLLTDDQSFPYSDKDVELICGSLVMIRKGIVQVIHLTVKEFITSPQEKKGFTSSSLLVNPESGSLQLTLVCLRCISKYAEPLVDLKSKVPYIDWALDPSALERRRVRAPLLEYASFSWLAHLIECKLDDLYKITQTIQKTFGSSTTFSWIEMCMVSQPDSVLRLLVGINDVHDLMYGPHQGLRLRQEASTQFLFSWCTAMSCIFEEYGALLAQRPWQVYLIDLYDIFSVDPVLQDLWQKHGETPLREKDLRLNGYQAFRPQQEHSKPHLQLQRPLRTKNFDADANSIFLVHNEAQNLYIWGELEIKGDSHCIYVQHDKTGQRLPPAEDLGLEPDQSWHLINFDSSPNGEYLVLVYRSKKFLEGKTSTLTLAWRIIENMSFKRRMNCEPWARVIFRHISDSLNFGEYSETIMFKDDHCCVTPIGTLDLRTGSRLPLPPIITEWIGMATGFFYSRSGESLFISNIYEPTDNDNTFVQTRRVEFLESSHFVDFCWEDKRRRLANVSPSGRYLVLGRPDTFRMEKTEEEVLHVYDTKIKKTIKLPFPKPLNYFIYKLDFSHDEARLIAFLGVLRNLIIVIWDCLGSSPRLTSHASLYLDRPIDRHGIHVHKAKTSAITVTGTRIIQRIELGDTISFLDLGNSIDEYHEISTISWDGSHCALVSYDLKGGEVQKIDLASPDAPARHLMLQWSQSDIPETLAQGKSLPIGISRDLRIFIINAEVFDLTTTSNDRDPSEKLTLTPFTMEGAPALLRPHRHQIESWGLKCLISSCNSYVLYISKGDQWGQESRYSSVFLLYRIDIQKRTSARLELTLPQRMISIHASFHPSLPLLTLSYAPPTARNLSIDSPPEMRSVVCDLRSLEMTNLGIPRGQLTQAIKKDWRAYGRLPQLLFSGCGTFFYLENLGVLVRKDWWFQRLNQIDTAPLPSRYIHSSLSLDNSLVIFHDDDNTSVTLELIKFDEQGFWRGTRPAVLLRDIASYSSHLGDADRCLLLGANDDEKMRMLIAPHDERTPVIKTLSLTFAEAQARLEREWQRLQVGSQDQDLENTVEIRR